MKKYAIALFSLLLCNAALADVQLRIKDIGGGVNTISSNGQKARIENKNMPGYAIVDYASGQFMMVDPQRKRVLSANIDADSGGEVDAGLSVGLKDKGGGQKIAGYATRKFEFSANGETCGTVYASSKLMNNREIRSMFQSMRGMQRLSGGIAVGISGFLPACQSAHLRLADAMKTTGMPMRILDAGGKLISEVMSVDTGKKLAGDYYQIPGDMPVVSMDQQMNRAAGRMQRMMENMPNMNQMMEQMQQGDGQITPEMRQHMEKLQEMLQQMQQQ